MEPSELYQKSLYKYRNELTLYLTIMVISIGVMSSSGGSFDPCEARMTVFARTASCSLAEKDMIALYFQLKPTLIEI